ncbi:MAG: hydantoinase/oxoprolinase family protein [Burkholderiales bacterium]|nr:hydantoinase/oxoprolinase family protein [Burkholderiales bacterium]
MRVAAIDIGGTFTDCIVFDEGRLLSLKVPSTPPDLERGLLDALAHAAALFGKPVSEFLGELPLVLQGTTAALNTVLTRTGAKVGMLTTEGFRDVIETRRGIKAESLYNVFIPPYEPLVPRHLRLGVGERTRYTGEVLQPTERRDVEVAAAEFRAQGVESVAVCFLYSYLNPGNERVAGELATKFLPGIAVSLSSEVLPIWREYERFSTTVINAYVAPKLANHLNTLERKLGESGFRGHVMLMTGGGLLESPAYCSSRAVHLLGSGPAGSANAALYISRALELPNVISVDMGGTSFDVCLIRDGQIKTTSDVWIDGHRVAVKSIDSESIGAGGGSIAWVDKRQLLRVGPQSAGAVPGPACYGAGGVEPTVTDANLVMGFLAPSTFRWGDRSLDRKASEVAIRRVGEAIGLDADRTAAAIYETVNEVMANGIIRLTTQRGIDPRDFVLVAGGGAGAIHAAAIAERVGLDHIVVPSYAGVYSAFGILSCDRGVEAARSFPCTESDLTAETLAGIYGELEREATTHLVEQGVASGSIALRRTVDMRYVKQFHEVEVDVPEGDLAAGDIETIVRRFHDVHRRVYTFSMEHERVEFLTFRLRASCVSDLRLPTYAEGTEKRPRSTDERPCLVDGARRSVPVFDGARFEPGDRLEGPGLIEEATTTIYVPARYVCTMDRWRNYHLERVAA